MTPLNTIAAAAGASILLLAALIGVITGTLTNRSGDKACDATQPSAGPNTRDIPPTYLRLYQATGIKYGIPWTVLAAIGRTESDHGANPGTSTAGARGPMQFMPATWSTYGIDGNNDGHKNIMDPADAIPTAARYLRANGAPTSMRKAVFAYNHSRAYVNNILKYANHYDKGIPEPAAENGCDTSAPITAPNVIAAKVITYAKAQLGKPYIYGGTGPTGYDCSGLTMMAYRAAGIAIPRQSDAQYWRGPRIPPRQEEPGDLVFFDFKPGHTGPGHVGIVYDVPKGLMIAAPHTGAKIRIQSYRNYPGGYVGFTRPSV